MLFDFEKFFNCYPDHIKAYLYKLYRHNTGHIAAVDYDAFYEWLVSRFFLTMAGLVYTVNFKDHEGDFPEVFRIDD